MWGNDWRTGLTKEQQTKLEQEAGRRRNAQVLVEQIALDWMVPLPIVYIDAAQQRMMVRTRYYVDVDIGDVVCEEPFDGYPSDELIATLMLLGKKR